MDKADRKILRTLQEQPHLTMRELGDKTGISHTPCWRRLSRMKDEGIVSEKRYVVDPASVGFDLTILCFVRLKEHDRSEMRAFETAILDVPEVLSCYTITGEHDYMLRVIARGVEGYETTVKDALMQLPNVGFIQTCLALSEIKNTSMIPI